MNTIRAWKDRLMDRPGRDWTLGFAVFLLVLALRGPALLSRGWGNAGMAMLTHIPATAPEKPSIRMISQAENLLRRAMVWDEKNSGVHRGLGWTLAMQDEGREAGIEWRAGDFTAQEFIQVGKVAARAGQHGKPVEWYERAAWVEPDLGDPWYYIGLVYEETEHWQKALEAHRRAIAAGTFTDVSPSSPHYRMGVIYLSRVEPRKTELAMEALDEAIELGAFRSSWEAADAHYRRGVILKRQGREPAVYAEEFEQAVAIHPEHAMAHVLLGRAYYEMYGDVGMAEEEIDKALASNPQNKWAFLHLGDVYRQATLYDEAQDAYLRALEIDAGFQEAQRRLQALVDER